jgi:hypothetical protein
VAPTVAPAARLTPIAVSRAKLFIFSPFPGWQFQ